MMTPYSTVKHVLLQTNSCNYNMRITQCWSGTGVDVFFPNVNVDGPFMVNEDRSNALTRGNEQYLIRIDRPYSVLPNILEYNAATNSATFFFNDVEANKSKLNELQATFYRFVRQFNYITYVYVLQIEVIRVNGSYVMRIAYKENISDLATVIMPVKYMDLAMDESRLVNFSWYKSSRSATTSQANAGGNRRVITAHEAALARSKINRENVDSMMQSKRMNANTSGHGNATLTVSQTVRPSSSSSTSSSNMSMNGLRRALGQSASESKKSSSSSSSRSTSSSSYYSSSSGVVRGGARSNLNNNNQRLRLIQEEESEESDGDSTSANGLLEYSESDSESDDSYQSARGHGATQTTITYGAHYSASI